jgi:tetratricopeptide (TPR) repeat protein
VKQATIHHHAGNLETAIPLLHEALSLIDAERDPRLLLCARHNLIDYTIGTGQIIEAQRLYRDARSLYRSFNEPWVQNRRKWVRGKIAYGLGQLRQAEVQLSAARDGFMVEGIPYDTALVSLELAQIYAQEGRTEELKRISAEMLPIFASRHIHREALAALAFFRQAVEAEKASVELIANVAAYLRRAEGNPELRFEGEGRSS